MSKNGTSPYRGAKRRRDRKLALDEKAIGETEKMTRRGISIITLFAGDDTLVPELYACFRFARPTTPREFHEVVSEALKKEGLL